MKAGGKFLIGILFTLLFLNLVTLGTIYFRLLNQSYLFKSFEKSNLYGKIPGVLAKSLLNDADLSFEEKLAFSAIAPNIPVSFVEDVVERNTIQVLDFLHGKNDDIVRVARRPIIHST